MIALEPKTSRLKRGRAVTILAGFKCRDGIVVCADSQETVEHSKKSVPKIRFEGTERWKMAEDYEPDLAVAFCGSGWGPMIDKVIDNAWQVMKRQDTLDDVCEAAEDSIIATFAKFSGVYQKGHMPEVDLIYGVKIHGMSRLFSAAGPVVNEHDGWCSAGQGGYMVDFLASKMYGSHLTTRQAVILAAYILFQAKEHVDGCGGTSQIAALRELESSGLVDFRLIESVINVLSPLDGDFGKLLLGAGELVTSPEEFKREYELVMHTAEVMREHSLKELIESRRIFRALIGSTYEKDELGLPVRIKPSASQTSEDQP